MKADLEILARELQMIAEEGRLPDGDGATASAILWAEGWLLSLAELGIRPGPVGA
jgi:hypothetical protein